MSSIEVSRFVLAEPSSVALVLAGPAARELWPHQQSRPVAAVGDRTAIRVDPPRRSSVGFVADLAVQHDGLTVGIGRLTIRRARRDDAGCDLSIVLTGPDDRERGLRRDARRYLDNVARISLERSSAA